MLGHAWPFILVAIVLTFLEWKGGYPSDTAAQWTFLGCLLAMPAVVWHFSESMPKTWRDEWRGCAVIALAIAVSIGETLVAMLLLYVAFSYE